MTTIEARTTNALRGDYSQAAADFTVSQDWDGYDADAHDIWRTLYRRQSELLPGYACEAYLQGLHAMGAEERIPRFSETNEKLRALTGWQIVAVPGFIPDAAFFDHLANRRFPVTVWIRRRDELDYLVEPDLFHDFFGHVPMLTDPVFADYLQSYGRAGKLAERHGGLPLLARLYWYMVEFGLLNTPDGLRAYGAGILSSRGETVYAVESRKPNQVAFDLVRVMRTDYMIDDYQKTYFVLDSFEQLFDATRDGDLLSIYRRFADRPGLDPARTYPGDSVLQQGEIALPAAAE